MLVRADLNISLDGYATTTDGTADNPMGEDWSRLVDAYTATKTFRARVLGDTSGSGTDGVDERYAARYFDQVGAEIMGAGMFGLHLHGDDPNWRGWWGDEPPFHGPVFVLTHALRESIEMRGGTVFHFIAAEPHEALARAVEAANGQDVRIGGGPTVVRAFLREGLIDVLHVAIAPILLGGGINLWSGLRGIESRYTVESEVAESGTIHVTLTRARPTPYIPWRPAGKPF